MELNDLVFPAPYSVKDGCLGYDTAQILTKQKEGYT